MNATRNPDNTWSLPVVQKAAVPAKTGIEWTDATWNPVVGCTPVSPGCLNCYAATMARRLEAMGRPEYAPREEPLTAAEIREAHRAVGGGKLHDHERVKEVRIAEVRNVRAVFTGEVREVPHRLDAPLHWRKPRRIFVNSMSDLFHEAVSFEFIDRVFAVMALAPQHTFQVLTKRPERMAEYLRGVAAAGSIQDIRDHLAFSARDLPTKPGAFSPNAFRPSWPLPNVWLGTSVEDQQRADERIPHLLRCPASMRFLSCEPLLGPVDLTRVDLGKAGLQNVLDCRVSELAQRAGIDRLNGIDWCILGGESGAHARPCNVAWVRSIVEQCKAAGVPCFVKQLGAKPYESADDAEAVRSWGDARVQKNGEFIQIHLKDKKGGTMSEWPEHLRIRESPSHGAR